ncbi:Fungal chitin synthase [Macrophomina phaseolina MS6]|uniref:Fungal chitin synthase n=1 Tax=Macrophomina phaseolina (strain MS6) TaxID=1126212 RepID=K2RYI6_MACPH|nr:Fungal chitin synthase [Macrophomina phaseolina MS6]
MASVVGYREESALFQRVLESYKPSDGLELLLVGIDGNEKEDLRMAQVVREVYPGCTTYIPIAEPLGIKALRFAELHAFGPSYAPPPDLEVRLAQLDQLPKDARKEANDKAMLQLIQETQDLFASHGLLENKRGSAMEVICLYQHHMCKKDIIFTNTIASIVFQKARGLDLLWTSDSDTLVMPDTLSKVLGAMNLDEAIGGSSATLGIHNAQENWQAKMVAAMYWSDLAIARSVLGSTDTIDCLPGPCAAFRVSAIERVIFSWYTQTCLGVRMVVNDDRHLTTLVLLQNYKVTNMACALALTDTPTTISRWVLQQLRWERAVHVEGLQYPHLYAKHGPALFFNALNRYYYPICLGLHLSRYVWDGEALFRFSIIDMACRMLLYTLYNAMAHQVPIKEHPDKPSRRMDDT